MERTESSRARPTAAAGASSVTSTRPMPSVAPGLLQVGEGRHRPVAGHLRPVAGSLSAEVERGHALLLTVGARREGGVGARYDEGVIVTEGRVGQIVHVRDLEGAPFRREADARPPDVARVFSATPREEEDPSTQHLVFEQASRGLPAQVGTGHRSPTGVHRSTQRDRERVEISSRRAPATSGDDGAESRERQRHPRVQAQPALHARHPRSRPA